MIVSVPVAVVLVRTTRDANLICSKIQSKVSSAESNVKMMIFRIDKISNHSAGKTNRKIWLKFVNLCINFVAVLE